MHACSGTTGSPKGVEVTHENIVSGIAALQTYTEEIGIEVRPSLGYGHRCRRSQGLLKVVLGAWTLRTNNRLSTQECNESQVSESDTLRAVGR